MKSLATVSILIYGILLILPQAHAGLTDDFGNSAKLIRQNTRTLEKITEVVHTCTGKVRNGELSMLPACDSVIQKFNIDVSKWLDENRIALEDLIYPMTVPDSIDSYKDLNSANVLGTDDITLIGEHTGVGLSYINLVQQFADECASSAKMYDIDTVKGCLEMNGSLNDHFRDFNTNVKADYDAIGPGLDSETLGD